MSGTPEPYSIKEIKEKLTDDELAALKQKAVEEINQATKQPRREKWLKKSRVNQA